MATSVEHSLEASPESLRAAILSHAHSSIVRIWERATPREKLFAVSLALRDRLIYRALDFWQKVREKDAKVVSYLSMEFLLGKSLENNLICLGLMDECRAALEDLGTDLEELMALEPDAALGNGGLGRLAACFLDSMAAMGIPGIGYGINYEFGLFRQEIIDGKQVERPDEWREDGTPWIVARPDELYEVPLYGHVEHTTDEGGIHKANWIPGWRVMGMACDMPIAGYAGRSVALLRLFAARASHEFDMEIFNEGDYVKAVEQKAVSETISKVLYPSEQPQQGKALRLIQEFFLVSCALQDMLKRTGNRDPQTLPDKAAIQLNDTHPALAVPELMRLLVDGRGVDWKTAWTVTKKVFSYTNHTLLPEALERWPVDLVGEVLPRHLEIIYEINARFLDRVKQTWPGDDGRANRMSIIEEGEPRQVRMANLAIIGSHAVNGVAAVHSELVKTRLVPDFYEAMPEKFQNKTNGVTPRQWLLLSNPPLAKLITESIGDDWVTDLDQLRQLETMAEDPGFQERFLATKRENKAVLSRMCQDRCGLTVDADSMVDSQVKRIHEYKRQLMNVLHIIWRYLRIAEDGERPAQHRTYVISGKAAPGYWVAKQVIELIHAVGDAVRKDLRVSELMSVVFVPDYSVTAAEAIIPATDLSEQISTAGFEASGTGNMKFAMNGALTVGTLDGANIEIAEEVGRENIFIFGNTVEEIASLRDRGAHPREFYDASERIRRIMDTFLKDRFCPDQPERFRWVWQRLVESWDPYFHLADLDAYLDAQQKVDELYQDRVEWARKAILNVARMGKFSSDRTIAEYASEIWGVQTLG